MARVLALLLVALLVLGTIASIVFTHAHGEEIVARDAITLDVEFLEEEQALRIRQRLLYINRTGGSLDRVEFSLYANMFRRQTALMYEGDVWQDVFPLGNAPGGRRVFAHTGRWRGRRLGNDGRRGAVFARCLRSRSGPDVRIHL